MECVKLKCFNCQIVIECKIYIKKHKYNIYKVLKKYNRFITYSKNWKCNTYTLQKEYYQYVIKKYYINCIRKKGKCIDYKDLPSKYISNNNYS